ncbi:hypothetical protein DSL72_008951 [Monilinia vaccinii-corymbosi]|uniref:Uncharacterized protein n=1 Tax=Monilinia vaccinii-corymbosi TaxID=61207 RepID=A0A8A3PSP8_9HELO|nr:hypothetical protein DSL72_008951 [Monilinia vaccinii-corymbosi]
MQNVLRKEIDNYAIATLDLAPVTPYFNIVNCILEANRTLDSLQALQIEAIKGHKHLAFQDSLLLYNNCLYSASDLKTALHKLHDFHRSNPTQPGLPAQLLEWIKLYKNRENDYDYTNNNKPISITNQKLFFETTL